MDLAMKTIRDFMIKEKPSLQGRNDSEILAEAEKLAGELLIWADRANEVQSAINDLASNHRQKWQPYKEALYLFDEALVYWHDAERLCESKKSKLIIIQNDKEEAFLENEIKNEQHDFWIGLYYIGRWKWIDETALLRGYWVVGKPDDLVNKRACAIKAKCATPLQCWENCPRLDQKRSICKKKPDKRWFN
ncbi:CD209 antigen-like protein E [Lacerta agilis]|uniref:CD209 antigen-like protein E n=1 Tax=Lacerta agilis TaxID=80427 RepID=UPI001419574B|nr:CD209 antigen-like protein E [Lacerta agilis]